MPTLRNLFTLSLFAIPLIAQTPGTQPVTTTPSLPFVQETTPTPFDKYPLGPDSQPQPAVPKGKTFHFDITNSKIFPETSRSITVYVSAQYKADKPACTFVFLDGIGFNATTVFDNLIAQHAMPVMIAIGISSGTVHSVKPDEDPRYDRSFEFDNMTDRLARFILDEVLPAVESHPTPDGLAIHLSQNPDDRAIAGASTGGIGSFTVAWQHPETFHRVLTSIGTFVGMRGGDGYYVLVRKTEPKPLRIFMEDGANDEWAGAEFGDWWMSNVTMNRALAFAGYDVTHSWGAGTHNGAHAASIFPDAVRWLWRDWPAPITAKSPGNRVLKDILAPGEGWTLVSDHCDKGLELAVTPHGQIRYSTDHAELCQSTGVHHPFAIGADGKLYRAGPQGGLERIDTSTQHGEEVSSANALHIHALTVRNNGDVYALTEPQEGRNQLWLIPTQGPAKQLDENLKEASGLAISPDGLWLMVAQGASRYGISYRIQLDGSTDAREPFYDFALPAGADTPGPKQIAMDVTGRPFVATSMGIQIFDRNGRSAAVLPLPIHEAPTGISFGGENFDTLFLAVGDKVYKRKLHVKGAPPWAPAFKLPPFGAG